MGAVLRCVEEHRSRTSLREFCAARTMSLRSRVDLLEQLSAVVANAYRRGFAFREFTAGTIEIDYAHGQLAMHVGDEVSLLPSTPRSWARGVSTADLLVAANVIHLGRIIGELVGVADASLTALVDDATSLDPAARPASAVVVHARLREWLERSDWVVMRWSWA